MRPAVAHALDVLDDRVQLTAAIATHFDPFAVLGADSLLEDDRAEAIDGLAALCEEVEVAGSGYRHWAMRPEARRRVLQAMGTRPDFTGLLDAIEAPPNDLFATYLRQGLRGEDLGLLVPSDGAPHAPGNVDLDCLLRAARFLQGLPTVRTNTGDLERRVRREIALTDESKALQAVVPPRLVGRELEYDALLGYRSTVLATDGDWVPSFVLVGPGGVGKSALVSKFVSDQRREVGAAPLIYLDFDRATLIGATPLDLTFEFARQLGLAELALEQPLDEFRERTRSLLGGQENVGIDASGAASSAAQRDLASLLSAWPHRASAVTIVFDTFEEVAIRGVTAVRDALQWVADLRNAVQLPQLHLIVCGRAVMPDAPHLEADDVAAMFNAHRELSLQDLTTAKAVELLTVLGVEPALAQRIPPVFGGNPLVLKLLHRFVTTNDSDEIDQLLTEGTRARQDAPSGEVGLRFVYERILNRIKKPRVKALAYPGVVLRRVTPELILKVLAPTCPVPLDVTTPADAEQAFNELAEHVWLVTRIAPDTVVHRADVRRLLVPGLEHSSDVDTRAIHVAAARYYAERPTSVPEDVARIEEIYHLGLLDDLPQNMPESLAEEVVRQLAADIEFWPVRSRATVKSLAGRHIQLTEEEVATLAAPRQVTTRGFRLEKRLESYDIGSAAYEEAQLGLLGEDENTTAAIPDSRWRLLFDRGDFEFMTEASRVLTAYDRYFTAGPSQSPSSSPTHEHPWFIALAILLVERGERPVFSDTALAALDSSWDEVRRYGAALAALTGDRTSPRQDRSPGERVLPETRSEQGRRRRRVPGGRVSRRARRPVHDVPDVLVRLLPAVTHRRHRHRCGRRRARRPGQQDHGPVRDTEAGHPGAQRLPSDARHLAPQHRGSQGPPGGSDHSVLPLRRDQDDRHAARSDLPARDGQGSRAAICVLATGPDRVGARFDPPLHNHTGRPDRADRDGGPMRVDRRPDRRSLDEGDDAAVASAGIRNQTDRGPPVPVCQAAYRTTECPLNGYRQGVTDGDVGPTQDRQRRDARSRPTVGRRAERAQRRGRAHARAAWW